MRYVAWGYAIRNLERKQGLVATRSKKDDPNRIGQLVLPGGGLKENEEYAEAAIRETLEECGIESRFKLYINPVPKMFEKPKLVDYVTDSGLIVLRYTDSGKEYQGKLVALEPIYPKQEPKEQEWQDAKNPRYLDLEEIFERQEEFTPACQALIDFIKEFESTRP